MFLVMSSSCVPYGFCFVSSSCMPYVFYLVISFLIEVYVPCQESEWSCICGLEMVMYTWIRNGHVYVD
jgi:hypothetical protein